MSNSFLFSKHFLRSILLQTKFQYYYWPSSLMTSAQTHLDLLDKPTYLIRYQSPYLKEGTLYLIILIGNFIKTNTWGVCSTGKGQMCTCTLTWITNCKGGGQLYKIFKNSTSDPTKLSFKQNFACDSNPGLRHTSLKV